MKKIFIILFLIFAMSDFNVAQSRLPEFDKAKQIRLLESTRKDVKRIFADYEHDDSDDDYHSQDFSTKNAGIEVSFAKVDCSDDSEYWNVAEWVVTKIVIFPENPIKVKDFNFSSFTKKMKNEESLESYAYQDEKSGIIFVINGNKIDKIILYPPKSNIAFLCSSENTSEILSGEKGWLILSWKRRHLVAV